MSHIIEEYAKSLGVRVGKPIFKNHFFPIKSNKFITFHTNDKKSPARHYDHWSLVLSLIKPYLSKNNIDIIQIGSKDDPVLDICDLHYLECTFKQMGYIIENAELHLGIDSLPVHLASLYDKKIVSLYSNLYPECSRPVWNNKSETKLLSPDFTEIKASFSDVEKQKRVNEIKPEEVCAAVLDLLKIKHDFNSYETLNIGSFYSQKIIEAIPNFKPAPDFKPERIINLRCDLGLKEDCFLPWLKYKLNLLVNRKVDLDIITQFKSNIVGMTIFMDDDCFDEEYFEGLDLLNINYMLICRDLSKIDEIRFKFFDREIDDFIPKKKKDLDFCDKVCNNTFYKSNKVLLSNNKEYSSKAAWEKGVHKTSDTEKVIDSEYFWEEVEHLNIYNHGKSKKK